MDNCCLKRILFQVEKILASSCEVCVVGNCSNCDFLNKICYLFETKNVVFLRLKICCLFETKNVIENILKFSQSFALIYTQV